MSKSISSQEARDSIDLNADSSLTGTNGTLLCRHVDDCPDAGCSDCVGAIEMADLKLIEPELTNENIQQTIRIYEVLVK